MKLQPVLNVTFPRSGHGWLSRMLWEYFKDEYRYSNFYNDSNAWDKYETGGMNAVISEYDFVKQHDFIRDIKSTEPQLFIVPKNLSCKYFILYRKEIPAIVSWYEIYVRTGAFEDSQQRWEWFADVARHFYRKWIIKWVYDEDIKNKNKLLLTYDDLYDNTEQSLRQILKFMGVKRISNKKLQTAITENPTTPFRNPDNFKYGLGALL